MLKFREGTKVKVRIKNFEIEGVIVGVSDNGRYKVNCFGSEIGCFEEDMEEYNAKNM